MFLTILTYSFIISFVLVHPEDKNCYSDLTKYFKKWKISIFGFKYIFQIPFSSVIAKQNFRRILWSQINRGQWPWAPMKERWIISEQSCFIYFLVSDYRILILIIQRYFRNNAFHLGIGQMTQILLFTMHLISFLMLLETGLLGSFLDKNLWLKFHFISTNLFMW